MLVKRMSKTVWVSKAKTNGTEVRTMNIPKEVVQLFGRNFIFDIYDDHVEMTPVTNMKRLAELEEKEN